MKSSLDIVQRLAAITNEVIVAFSCGKDAQVSLDLCTKYFSRVEAYYFYAVPDLSFHNKVMDFVHSRYGITVRKLPSVMLARSLKTHVFRKPNAACEKLKKTKQADLEEYIRQEFAMPNGWIVWGIKKCDSLQRRGMVSVCKGIDEKTRRAYPIGDWSHHAVYQYLKKHRIPLSGEYPILGRSYGGMLEAKTLMKIKERFPDDYEKIRRRFPHVEAEIRRQAWHGGGRPDSAEPDQAGGLQSPSDQQARESSDSPES